MPEILTFPTPVDTAERAAHDVLIACEQLEKAIRQASNFDQAWGIWESARIAMDEVLRVEAKAGANASAFNRRG